MTQNKERLLEKLAELKAEIQDTKRMLAFTTDPEEASEYQLILDFHESDKTKLENTLKSLT
jgi:hypothetical protein